MQPVEMTGPFADYNITARKLTLSNRYDGIGIALKQNNRRLDTRNIRRGSRICLGKFIWHTVKKLRRRRLTTVGPFRISSGIGNGSQANDFFYRERYRLGSQQSQMHHHFENYLTESDWAQLADLRVSRSNKVLACVYNRIVLFRP